MNVHLPESFTFNQAAEILQMTSEKFSEYLETNEDVSIPRSMVERIAATEGVDISA
jgi:hypothetical protein